MSNVKLRGLTFKYLNLCKGESGEAVKAVEKEGNIKKGHRQRARC